MTPAQFAEFWRLQGHRVVETPSCFWYAPRPLVFMSIPYHLEVTPSAWELSRLCLLGPCLAARYPTPAEGPDATGGLFVVTGRDYDMPCLHQKARNQTRRALEQCCVEQMEFSYLAEHGHALNVQTFERQGRDVASITEPQWRGYCKAAAQIPGFETWGAFVEGRLAAFMVNALVDDCFGILHQSSSNEGLAHSPNNALTFTLTRMKLQLPEVGYVSYGLKSLDMTAGVDHFKERMGFKLRPRAEGLAFHPALRVFLGLGGGGAIGWMAKRHPESDLWRKASRVIGMTVGEPNRPADGE